MTAVILDASALLALLNDETGADRVAEVLSGARIGAVNYAEVVSHFIHAGVTAETVEAMLSPLPISVVNADLDLARAAGVLRAATSAAGLSLGDRFCLALALRDKAVAYTADRNWRKIEKAVGADIVLIR